MANTVTSLSYANTFGDWVVTTNALVNEIDAIGYGNWQKPTGYLSVGNNPSSYVPPSGTAILATQNTIIYGTQLQVTGTGSSATIQNNLTVTQGQVYFSNTTLGLTNAGQANIGGPLLALGSGYGLQVANNALVSGNVVISGFEAVTGNLSVVGPTNLSNTLSVSGNTSLNQNLVVGSSALVNSLQSNTNITTDTLTATYRTYVYSLQANTSVSTATLSVTGDAYVNTLQANTSINTASLVASSSVLGNNIQSNNSITSVNSSVTNTAYINNLVANTSINACNATMTANTLTVGTGGLNVIGNFTINGSTVYNTPNFVISALTPNQTAYFGVYRSPGANAYIKWDQANTYWSIADVSGNSYYYRVLTTQQIVDNLTSTSTITTASANTANALNNNINTANTFLQNQITANVAYIAGVDSTQNTNITAVNNYSQTAFARANTSANAFTGTTGTAYPSSGIISFSGTNGVTITGSGSTLTIAEPQNLQTSASPTFNSLTLTNALAINQGGTGATSAGAALTALLPVGTTAGYVLTTGGPGSFYWAAGGGGGSGATPGTTISSTYQSYTANGSGVSYSSPVYVPGTDQLRVYFDGVRQFPGQYTETSGNTGGVGVVTFGSAVPAGVNILLEVDGYIINPYYANNIAYTVNATIGATANTIQKAIDGLTSIVALSASPSLTGVPTSVTPTTNTSNTMIATTAFVQNQMNNGNTYTMSVSGNAGTVTNGVYTTGSYSNPSWITSLANSKITGLASSATTDTTNASNITSGTLPSARLSGSYTGITGVGTLSAGSIPTSLITGLAASATTDTTNASNITSGTLSASRLPYTMNQSVGTTNNVQFTSGYFGNTYTPTYSSGAINAEGNITAFYSSDRKFKENIREIPNALDAVKVIGGKLFDWTDKYLEENGGQDDYFRPKSDYGVIAQDVQQVFPVAVRTRKDGSLAVDYEKLCALAFQAINELKSELDALKGNSK